MTHVAPSEPRPRPWRALGWTAAGAVLLVPWIAMQFTEEVAWDLADFGVAALLLGGTGLGIEAVARRVSGNAYRAGAALALCGGLVLVWVNLAVGIVGSENNPTNLVYGVVIAVGALGAVLGRFRAAGMAKAMVATAAAQAAVGAVHAALDPFALIIAGGFVALWLGCAALFHVASRAGREDGRPGSVA